MPVELNSDDCLSRCIIFDRAFDQNIHVNTCLWHFDSSREDGVRHESAVLRRLAPKSEDVHRIGCAIAAAQNERKNSPPPGRTRRYYCGFRTAKLSNLPNTGDGYSITYTNVPENGEEAHVDVALKILVEGKSARANRRTDAGLALAEAFGPPEPFCCECDVCDGFHPIALWGVDCLIVGISTSWDSLIPTVGNGEALT